MTGPAQGRRHIRVADLRGELHPLWHRERRERWRAVVGYEGYYEVSDLGRVKSVARVVMRSNGSPLRVPERILRPGKRPDGHLQVILCRDGVPVTAKVHRLVAEAFLGGEGSALHWNDNPVDNRVENLRYGTQSDNGRDAARNRKLCSKGHAFTPENTLVRKDRDGQQRECLTCARERALRPQSRARRAAAARKRRAAKQRNGAVA